MKNLSIFFSALVALLFSVAETSAQITPPYYNPANVNITGGAINGTTVGETTPANATASRLRLGASNDLYLTRYAAKQVMISGDGTGATTNAGLILGYSGISDYGAIWSSAVIPTSTNWNFYTNNLFTSVNGTNAAYLRVSTAIGLQVDANSVSTPYTLDSSSPTTGSLRTAGGLGVAKKAYFGDTVISTSSAGGRVISIQNDTNTNQTQFHANNTNGRYEAGVLTSGHSYAGSITTGAAFHLYANNADIAQVTSSGVTISDGKTLQVGSGSTTAAGWIAGYSGTSGYGAIWNTGVTPSTSNYSLAANASSTQINGVSSVLTSVNNAVISRATSTGLNVESGTLSVGTGSGTSAGLIAGYLGISGYGAIWSTGVTPSTTNYALSANSTITNVHASSEIRNAIAGAPYLTVTATTTTHVGNMVYDKTITTPGTTGAQTINKTTGRVNFAAAATSLVVTNSLATANSICHVTKATNDATMRLGACVAAAGSITIYADVAPAAETAVNFTVTN